MTLKYFRYSKGWEIRIICYALYQIILFFCVCVWGKGFILTSTLVHQRYLKEINQIYFIFYFFSIQVPHNQWLDISRKRGTWHFLYFYNMPKENNAIAHLNKISGINSHANISTRYFKISYQKYITIFDNFCIELSKSGYIVLFYGKIWYKNTKKDM